MRQAKSAESKSLTVDFGELNPKQQQFVEARSFYVCYGGARGGGKSHIARLTAVAFCLKYPGIRILIVRCHYNELEQNIINPIIRWLPQELYSYNGASHLMKFYNGSEIKFGHYDNDNAEMEFQGTEYEVVFIEEATQFSERAFQMLGGVIRSTNKEFPRRMYLTCNPGGVGHFWVKRLFIDKNYRVDPENPERNENPDDYTFIFATVDDNKQLLEASPQYLQQLANLPEDRRRAHRYGDWDALGGSYFSEFTEGVHTMKPFKIPDHWTLYRSFDYGLDMFACFWWAVDEDGRSWCFREYEHKGLIVAEAAKAIQEHTLPSEKIAITYAPPDMWGRQKDTGKSMAELFMTNGVGIVKSNNNRVQGHMIMKEMLMPIPLRDPFVRSLFPPGQCPDKLPQLMFFDNLGEVLEDIKSIQADEANPNDCAKQPHDITHTVDGCRYYCISRTLAAEAIKERMAAEEEEEEAETEYHYYMTGGAVTASYINY